MTIDLQYFFNMILGVVGSIACYLFFQVSQHEKRIQKIEDVQSMKIDELKRDMEQMERKIDALTHAVNELISIKIKGNV